MTSLDSTPPHSTRRWFHLSLRTFFVIVAACAAGSCAIGWSAHPVPVPMAAGRPALSIEFMTAMRTRDTWVALVAGPVALLARIPGAFDIPSGGLLILQAGVPLAYGLYAWALSVWKGWRAWLSIAAIHFAGVWLRVMMIDY